MRGTNDLFLNSSDFCHSVYILTLLRKTLHNEYQRVSSIIYVSECRSFPVSKAHLSGRRGIKKIPASFFAFTDFKKNYLFF